MSEFWSDEVTARIAGEIRRLRGDRSGQWLSDRTAELGQRVSRSTISEIETGRRKSITVADLILLAAALETAPIALVYPAPYGTDAIRVVPHVNGSKTWALQWFSGLLDGSTVEGFAISSEPRTLADDGKARHEYKRAYDENLAALRAAREIWELEGRLWALKFEKRARKDELTPDESAELQDGIADYRRRIVELRERHGW